MYFIVKINRKSILGLFPLVNFLYTVFMIIIEEYYRFIEVVTNTLYQARSLVRFCKSTETYTFSQKKVALVSIILL